MSCRHYKTTLGLSGAFFLALLFISCNGGSKKVDGGVADAAKYDTGTTPMLPEMVTIENGSFAMGGPGADEGPTHIVHIRSFYLGKYEVTVGEFRKFMNSHVYTTDAEKSGFSYIFNNNHFQKKEKVDWQCDGNGDKRPPSADNEPVIHISWNDAVAYCRWLSDKTGKNFRLPKEAEWEYAARGGKNQENTNFSGGDKIDNLGWYSGNSDGKTHPVGTKTPNSLGVYDLTGNAWEWCNDRYGAGYYFVGPSVNPRGSDTGTQRVLRGGN